MMRHHVVIAGGGPTGMMLAAELKLAGIDVAIVERRTTPELMRSGALGLHARTIEALDQRGIVDRFLAEGRTWARCIIRSSAISHWPMARFCAGSIWWAATAGGASSARRRASASPDRTRRSATSSRRSS